MDSLILAEEQLIQGIAGMWNVLRQLIVLGEKAGMCPHCGKDIREDKAKNTCTPCRDTPRAELEMR